MNSQYSIAVHILTLLDSSSGAGASAEIAGSVGVNPVVIRSVTGLLRKAGLLTTQRGVSGAQLTRPAHQISLLDVYRAVNAPDSVLKVHAHPNLACPVGAGIQRALEEVYGQAQAALESRLAEVMLSDITRAVHQQAS
ncbi:Rrf2 family transcriptional regulator [Deinococcus sp. QL22]|uniref:Rrf2 family transcriptional regulator n=1 Tax=Deinococcus sp. QL22 TaxID=2939437 RepID=UPI002016E681|nr:Rrf2 family transcriptional regulator [Deinococcus sp. QL22]UQN09770.1 Rrf2 family transcriptional regulator [Deinococcus sp. QL22]